MTGGGRRQRRHRSVDVTLGHEPGGPDDDERVRVVERGSHRTREGRTGAGAPDGERHLDGPAPERWRSPGQRTLDVARRRPAQAGQGAQRGDLHAGVGIGQTFSCHAGVAPVPGHDDAATPNRRVAFGVLIRGNIVAHLPSMSEPDASADGEAAANPTWSDAGPYGAAPLPPPPSSSAAAAAGPPCSGSSWSCSSWSSFS